MLDCIGVACAGDRRIDARDLRRIDAAGGGDDPALEVREGGACWPR
jgi:hypothetical protein